MNAVTADFILKHKNVLRPVDTVLVAPVWDDDLVPWVYWVSVWVQDSFVRRGRFRTPSKA